jgi:hypothetical protein
MRVVRRRRDHHYPLREQGRQICGRLGRLGGGVSGVPRSPLFQRPFERNPGRVYGVIIRDQFSSHPVAGGIAATPHKTRIVTVKLTNYRTALDAATANCLHVEGFWLDRFVRGCRVLMRLAVSLALTASTLIGCSPAHCSVTIRTIGSTASTWYTPHPQPIWRFAITNTGTRPVQWFSGVEGKDGNDTNYSRAGGFVDWPEGILMPGEGVVTNMIVPALTGSVWRATVLYCPTNAVGGKSLRTFADEWRVSN